MLKLQIKLIEGGIAVKKPVKIIIGLFVLIFISVFLILRVNRDGGNAKIIGIIQLVEHDALDSARNGFVDGLSEAGYTDGENIKIDYQNAQGDQSNCNLIVSKFIKSKSDLILAIATQAAQAAGNATKTIPILVTAVTDPAAAGLVKSNHLPQTNITGTSDLSPVEKQIELIIKLKPGVKKLGILYSSGEANSKYQGDIACLEAQKLGIETQVFTFSQASELQQITETMVQRVDAIYTPTDNLVASGMPIISQVATKNGVPVVCGETNVVSKGSVGTYGMDYYELGKLTAKQAIEILENKNTPQNMPIMYLKDTKLVLNNDIIKKLNIIVPQETAIAAEFIN
jgi:putative ABC transport system substrate-binding protein